MHLSRLLELTRHPLTSPPSLLPPPQRDARNLYRTLHLRQVDGRKIKHYTPRWNKRVPAGWEIARGDADDIRVCAAHPWQSSRLVFGNGDSYETASSSHAGACSQLTRKIEYLPHAQKQEEKEKPAN